MQTAPIPPDEAERLYELHRSAVLDTGEEDFFEDMIETVQQLVAAPVALISFVDDRRQWFKARRGLPIAEGPRELSFCAHAILSDAPLIVADARRDRRFRDNFLVTGEPYLTSYAAAPLRLYGGARIGTVCVADTRPRQWTPQDIDRLQACARMVSRHLDTRRASIEEHRQVFLETALSRAQTRYESVLNTMTEGMVVQGPSGAIIDSNPAAAAILGRPQDKLFGAASRDPHWRSRNAAGEDVSGDEHPAMVVLRTGEPQYNVVMSIKTPAGEERWLNINAYPVRQGEDPEVRQVVTVFRRIAPPEGLYATSKWANDRA